MTNNTRSHFFALTFPYIKECEKSDNTAEFYVYINRLADIYVATITQIEVDYAIQ